MRSLIAFFILATLMVSCSQGYKINVNIADHTFDGKMAYLTNYDTGDTIDSVKVTEKHFTLNGDIDSSYFARLIVDGNRFGMIVEPGEINVEWGEQIIARGTPLNDKLNLVNADLEKLEQEWDKIGEDFKNEKLSEDEAEKLNSNLEKRQMDIFLKCYEENKDNALGVWAFTNYLIYGNFGTKELEEILNKAPENYRNYKRIKKAVSDAQAVENTAEGKMYADFEVKGLDGNIEKLSDFVGKDGSYTLVDFWASWCGPCRMEIKGALTELYNKYNGKGLQVIGVAVWDKPEDTKTAIDKLPIPWHVMVGDHYMTEQTDLYGISGIPHIMLIDPNGIIVSRGLNGSELVETVDKIMTTKK